MKHHHNFSTLAGPMATASAYAVGCRETRTSLHPTATVEDLRASFGGMVPENGQDGASVISELIRAAEPGLVGTTHPGFHGWVMGGSHPTGVAADWLTSVWGQNAALYQASPAAAIAEETTCAWLLDLLDLPRDASVGLTSGATMAGFIGLAAARGEVLRRMGYEIEETGLQYAPPVTVYLSEDTHASNRAALRYLGFGARNIVEVAADDQGGIVPDDLARRMKLGFGPKIVIATAGHINSGAFDDFDRLADLAQEHGAWLHVDAAFGLWARTSIKTRTLTHGIDRADSWSVDGHKWLQVPFDAGFAIVKDSKAHRRAMDISATYLNHADCDGRNPNHFSLELSRRARGFAVWATIKALGRNGIAAMVGNHCDCASLLAYKLQKLQGIEILNDVVLNQVTLSFDRGRGMDDANHMTRRMEEALNADGAHFFRTATWKGRCVLRVSIINFETGPQDIQQLIKKIGLLWQQVQRD